MRKSRVNLPNRCYHLIVTADNREAFGGVRRSRAESRRPSRVAHRAFFLDDGERTRLVDLVRRVSRFSGVKLLAYGVMSNQIHAFVYIGSPERIDDAEIDRRIAALYSDVRFDQVMKKWNELAKRPDSSSFRRYRRSFLRNDLWLKSLFCKEIACEREG